MQKVRVYFKKENELHNALVYMKRTYGESPKVITNGCPKDTCGMVEVSEYVADILNQSYDTKY